MWLFLWSKKDGRTNGPCRKSGILEREIKSGYKEGGKQLGRDESSQTILYTNYFHSSFRVRYRPKADIEFWLIPLAV